ncbi:MAG: DUF1684 domain-containing protein [Vicinamibacterales bacterium]
MKTLAVSVLVASVLGATGPAEYRHEIEKYRADRLAELTAPDGWLAVAGLFWLHDGANVAGSDPSSAVRLPARARPTIGSFARANKPVTFIADPPATVSAGGRRVTAFSFEPEKGERSAVVTSGVTMFIIRRGDRFGVRMLDPESDARRHFSGLKYFPLHPSYRVSATFVPYSTPKRIPIINVLGMTVPMESPGYVEFTLLGKRCRLDPVYEDSKRENLFFLFKDPTSGTETYGAGRFLHAPLPVEGRVDLDFNRAYNPPCAFTAFATCPLPPRQNALPLRIEAGERKYQEHEPKNPEP